MALDGTGMIMRNLINLIGEKRINDVFATFDLIKQGVVDVNASLNSITMEQQAQRQLADQRHAEVMAAIAALQIDQGIDQGSARPLEWKNGRTSEDRKDHAT